MEDNQSRIKENISDDKDKQKDTFRTNCFGKRKEVQLCLDSSRKEHAANLIMTKLEKKAVSGLSTLLTINKDTINQRFHGEAILILSNPMFEYSSQENRNISNVTFDKSPLFCGKQIYLKYDYANSITKNDAVISMNKLTNKSMIVVCKLEELHTSLQRCGNVMEDFFVPMSVSRINTGKRYYKKRKPGTINQNSFDCKKDEYIILAIFNNSKDKSHHKSNTCWDEEFVANITKYFRSSVAGNESKHHGSTGKYYGVGLINKYTIDKNTGNSFGKFDSLKKGENQDNHDIIEENIVSDMKFCLGRLHTLLPKLDEYGNIILNVLEERCCELEKNKINESVYSGWICKNAQTRDFHQENDSSYTIVSIPFFDKNMQQKIGRYHFQFRWNRRESTTTSTADGFDIMLNFGTLLYYHGKFLFHRQQEKVKPREEKYVDRQFWNINIYHNRKLLNHIVSSIYRKETNKLKNSK